MDILIEKAEASDAALLRSIQSGAFERLYERYHDEGSPFLESEEDITRRMSYPDRDYYKITSEDTVIGGLTVRRLSEGDYYLGRLFVSPSLQGKGIGQHAIKLMEDLYPDAVRWTVDFPSDLELNRRCYESAGYRDTGRSEVKSDRLTLSLYEKGKGARIYLAAPRDLPVMLDVIRASFGTVAAQLGLTQENASRNPAFMTSDWLEREYSGGGFHGLYINGKLSGTARIFKRTDGDWELTRLAVLPSERHNGYGRLLTEHALREASQAGAERVIIGIVEGEVLRGWYESMGFVHMGCKTYQHLPFTVGEMEYVIRR
ncbi:MAG: GNAT family N-acetyltransferase [Eubacteriales bacterium]